MTDSGAPERREGAAPLEANGLRGRAGFRVLTLEPLAGGPVELEFFVECLVPVPLALDVSGDRSRGRPGDFTFTATFAGKELEDPMAGAPDLGGPSGVVTVSTTAPWVQPLVLNQYVRLERTRELLADGERGRLELICRRPLPLTGAQAADGDGPKYGATDAAVLLQFDLRRDDAALSELADGLLEQAVRGPLAGREHAFTLLLSLRSAADDRIEALTLHPDPAVAGRASLGR